FWWHLPPRPMQSREVFWTSYIGLQDPTGSHIARDGRTIFGHECQRLPQESQSGPDIASVFRGDIETGEQTPIFSDRRIWDWAVAFDGSWVVLVHEDFRVEVLDGMTGKSRFIIPPATGSQLGQWSRPLDYHARSDLFISADSKMLLVSNHATNK